MDSLIHRVKRSLAQRGPVATVFMCGAMLREKFAPACREIERRRQESDAAFDARYGVDTGGIVRPEPGSVVGSHWPYGINYQAVDPDEFMAALGRVPIQHEQFTFLDLGSGKGRALLLAAQFPFRRIIGVDYCEALNAVARQNICLYPASARRCADLNVVCADAAEYPLPPDPLVLFLFNPFGEPVMAKVLRNVTESLQRTPRRIVVIYFTPYLAGQWVQTGLFRRVQESPAILDNENVESVAA